MAIAGRPMLTGIHQDIRTYLTTNVCLLEHQLEAARRVASGRSPFNSLLGPCYLRYLVSSLSPH